jgi:hypothetical protein
MALAATTTQDNPYACNPGECAFYAFALTHSGGVAPRSQMASLTVGQWVMFVGQKWPGRDPELKNVGACDTEMPVIVAVPDMDIATHPLCTAAGAFRTGDSQFRIVGWGHKGDFSGRFPVPDWRDPNCTADLVTFGLGDTEQSTWEGVGAAWTALAGQRLATLVAGTAQLGGRTLVPYDNTTLGTPGSSDEHVPYVCAGENVSQLHLAQTRAIFATTMQSLGIGGTEAVPAPREPYLSGNPSSGSNGDDPYDFKFRGLAIYDAHDEVVINGGVFARGVNVGPGAALHADGGFPDPHLLDPRDRHPFPLDPQYGQLKIEGIYYAPKGLVVKGALKLSDAFVYVNGNLAVGNGIVGQGAVAATGNIYAEGRMDLAPDAAGLSLEAGGDIFLNAGPQDP